MKKIWANEQGESGALDEITNFVSRNLDQSDDEWSKTISDTWKHTPRLLKIAILNALHPLHAEKSDIPDVKAIRLEMGRNRKSVSFFLVRFGRNRSRQAQKRLADLNLKPLTREEMDLIYKFGPQDPSMFIATPYHLGAYIIHTDEVRGRMIGLEMHDRNYTGRTWWIGKPAD